MRATNGRPYRSNKTLSMPVGEDSISSRNVVRIYQKPSPVREGGSRRLTDEVSASLFALSFGGAQTNGSLNLGRGGAMFAKQTCHGAKRSMLASSRVMFAQPFGGEEINGFSIPR